MLFPKFLNCLQLIQSLSKLLILLFCHFSEISASVISLIRDNCHYDLQCQLCNVNIRLNFDIIMSILISTNDRNLSTS